MVSRAYQKKLAAYTPDCIYVNDESTVFRASFSLRTFPSYAKSCTVCDKSRESDVET